MAPTVLFLLILIPLLAAGDFVRAQAADPFQGVRPAQPTEPRQRPPESRAQPEPARPGLVTSQPFCQTASARGAMGPGGAQTTMRLTNTGAPCRYTLFHRVEQQIPTGSVAISSPPQSGRAETIQPNVVQYTPNRGFAGTDRFSISATPEPFRITFTVEVLPPGVRP